MLAGRTFDARDDGRAPSRVVVSANFARTAFPGMPFDAVIGQRIAAGGRQSLEIIGVVGDVALDVYGASTLVVYHAHRQFANNRNWVLSHVVATQLPPETILADVRAAVATLDPELVVDQAAPLRDVVGRGTSRERFALVLMAAFAGVSLLLATLGLYGVLAYAVGQRTQEIGIRMALGATAAQIRLTVLRQAGLVLEPACWPGRSVRWCSDVGSRRSPSKSAHRILAFFWPRLCCSRSWGCSRRGCPHGARREWHQGVAMQES